MGKTKRNASRWMESRFKLGDAEYPKWNEDFFDGRYQAKMRNGTRNYYSMEIDPLSYKVISWREYGKWAKRDAHQAARHNAKLQIIKLTNEIIIEQMQDLEVLWFEEEWYDEDYMGFDFSYSDEAYDYAERRRQQ
jgi:hypothetical protein